MSGYTGLVVLVVLIVLVGLVGLAGLAELAGLAGSAFIDFFQDKSQTDQSITEGSRPIRMLAPSLPVRAICPLMCHS